MTDTSNRQPDGGYILPNIPDAYLDNPVNEAARLAPLDAQLESTRADFDAFLDAHNVAKATGTDLDNLGALVGVTRLPGEGDELYRVRISATCQNGIGAVTQPLMLAYLQAATANTPVLVQDTARPGRFDVTFLAPPPQGAAIVPLIAAAKALGMDFTCHARSASNSTTRLGTFRLGEQCLGGGRTYITLKASEIVASGGALARVGAFRLGTERLSSGTAVSF